MAEGEKMKQKFVPQMSCPILTTNQQLTKTEKQKFKRSKGAHHEVQ